MSGFDLVIALIVVISVVVGIWRGFIKEAFSIASWVLAFWLGNAFCHEAGEFLASYISIPTETFRVWAGFVLVFIATLLAFGLLSVILSKLLLHGPIKTLDRVLGVGFGALRAAAIVVALLLVFRGFGLDQSAWWANSQFIPKFIPAADWVEDLLPQSLQRDETNSPSIESDVLKGVIEQNLPPELTEPAQEND